MDNNLFFDEVDTNSETEKTGDISKRAKLVRNMVAAFNQKSNLLKNIHDNNRSKSEIEKTYKYPDFFCCIKYNLDNFVMELLERTDITHKRVILQLHGGGYVAALKNPYRRMAGLYSEAAKGASVLTIDYRVAPENPYPAALEDAIAAYQWLLERDYKPEDIIFGGDSAGGGLAMALCHYIKDKHMPLPAGIVAMSPWTDVSISGETYVTKYDIDPVFGQTHNTLLYDNPYAGDEDDTIPYISPLFGDFEGFPPMLVQVGTDEMLLSDSREVVKKAKAANVKVRYTEYEGMFHVFQQAATIMPESKRAWSEVAKFFEVLWSECI